MSTCRAPLPRLVTVSLSLLVAGACALSPNRAQEGTQTTGEGLPLTMESPSRGDQGSRWVRVGRAGAAVTPDGPLFQVDVASLARRPIRVALRFATPEGVTGCVEEAELEPSAAHRFSCPRPELHPSVDYPVEIVIRAAGRKRPVERIRLLYRFDATQIAALQRHIGRMRTDG